MYADYDYYLSVYLLGRSPAVPGTEFPYWEREASRVIDLYTFGRLQRDPELVTEAVRDCACAVAEVLYRADVMDQQAFQAGAAGPLQSYSNDGESGTYALGESKYTESGKQAAVKKLVGQYLGSTDLLYSGGRYVGRRRYES